MNKREIVANPITTPLSGGGGANNPLVATVSGLLSKFTLTGCGFAKNGTKLLRHRGTKGICHSEVLAEESLLKGTKLLGHYGTKKWLKKQHQGHDEGLKVGSIREWLCHHSELVSESVDVETLKQCKTNSRTKARLVSLYALAVQGDNAFVQHDKKHVIARGETTKQSQPGMVLKRLLRFARNDGRVMKKCAFTLSEVLIVLAVLGVIAAMTIPDLIQDYQKKATATQVKKVYSTLNQVVTASTAENGPASNYFSANSTVDAETTEEFFETYWLPYFRIQKVADDGKTFYDSTRPYSYLIGSKLGTDVITRANSGRILFFDVSGTIYFINIMAWDGDTKKYSSRQEIIVDINGAKGPNTFGKDVFVFVANIDDSTVNPSGYNQSKATVNKNCSNSGNGAYCAAKIKRDGWKIADDYPW